MTPITSESLKNRKTNFLRQERFSGFLFLVFARLERLTAGFLTDFDADFLLAADFGLALFLALFFFALIQDALRSSF